MRLRLLAASLMLTAGLFSLVSCAGYRLGNIAGDRTKSVKSIYVPIAINKSIVPDIQTTVTSAVVRRLENDGTVETSSSEKADAEIDIVIKNVRRAPSRAVKSNVDVTSEYLVYIEADFTYTNRRTNTAFTIAALGKANYFIQQDEQEGERQALPLAADDLAYQIVRQITEGW